MTGREFMFYILENNLEDEEVFKDGKFLGFLTETEAAEKLEVGVASIRSMVNMGLLKGVRIGETYYIHAKFDKEEVIK